MPRACCHGLRATCTGAAWIRNEHRHGDGDELSDGRTDILGAGALNMQFDIMAMLLQQRTLLLTTALADPAVQKALIEEQRKATQRLQAYEKQGQSLVQRGEASTTFT